MRDQLFIDQRKTWTILGESIRVRPARGSAYSGLVIATWDGDNFQVAHSEEWDWETPALKLVWEIAETAQAAHDRMEAKAAQRK